MTAQTRATLRAYFETGDVPTSAQFSDLIDSSLNLAETSSQTVAGQLVFDATARFVGGISSVTALTTASGSSGTGKATPASVQRFLKVIISAVTYSIPLYRP